MGCCLSTRDNPKSSELHHPNGGAPPPLEEETVKEVLLETPVVPKSDDQNVEVRSAAAVINSDRNPPKEIVSEISEMYNNNNSVSESFSKDDIDGEVNQRPPARKRRRPAGGRGRGDRVLPSRRTVGPSPEKKGQVAPLRPSRGRPVVGQPRNVAVVNGRREGSSRRSRSPVRSDWRDTRRRDLSEEKSVVMPEPLPDGGATAEEVESLENPIVSLECFIFL